MRTNRSIPAVTFIPVLICPDAREAVASLSAAFGFDERLRIGENTALSSGSATTVHLSSPMFAAIQKSQRQPGICAR